MPTGVIQADADAVFAAGWDESALYHAVFVIALFNLMNRLVEGLGIELDPAYAESAGDGLANRRVHPAHPHDQKCSQGGFGVSGQGGGAPFGINTLVGPAANPSFLDEFYRWVWQPDLGHFFDR